LTVQVGYALLVGVGIVGMGVLVAALMFDHDRTRFRGMVVAGLAMTVGAVVLGWWLLSTTFGERIG